MNEETKLQSAFSKKTSVKFILATLGITTMSGFFPSEASAINQDLTTTPNNVEQIITTSNSSDYGVDLNRQVVQKDILVVAPTEDKNNVQKEPPISIALAEQKPSFPGGDKAMYEWLAQNIKYPSEAEEDGASGKITIQFIVEKDGSITNVKVLRGKHPALDKEAVRVVSSMPKWTPGRVNGQTVRVLNLLPVIFRVE